MTTKVFDPYALNVDLHCHSVFSDGTLAPEQVVERAKVNGVQWLALTDHDETGGLAAASTRAAQLGLGFIPGVEISVTWAHETVHIIGLNINPAHPVLQQGLASTRNGRQQRAQEIAEQLEKANIPNAYEGALKYASNPALISRTHFARFLVEQKICDTPMEVFGRYLVPGKPGYVPHSWARLSDAVAWIETAGGTAVIAHPARYRFNDLQLHTFIEEFCIAGGRAIEVITSAHSGLEAKRYAKLAQEYQLLASRGSDFHSPNESRIDLGALPPLPDSVEPVWAQWGIG